ncbi:uncharacterized protein SPSK_05968 [Sporothrix schenckii 1099-18]|uniref:Zn(2)-C6 fungal-type domain-containing protein n=1 Tax=Sporothrix schenckii 1099-18 TaxID=1397361 RepID=A0A0F2MIH2_SPOSC|nr:uncharacterized protein SPSK_05968 [Sporothrix schenckii 1099-18]KJR89488.1 hypothetical protein SPSK_05968 [Sporothrix schenckii 1099-18]
MSAQRTRKTAEALRCSTCKERKIKCDGTRPVCQNCQKAHRECRAGHAFELSWPKPKSRRALEGPKNDRKYLMVQSRMHSRLVHKGGNSYYFVNVLSEQVAAHHLLPYVSTSQGTRSILFDRTYAEDPYLAVLPNKAPSLYADFERLQSDGSGLMSYFYHEASNSLPQLDNEPQQFRDLLLRMSLYDNTASSKAVLYSLFCLSALRRYGNVQECAHFKILALQSLQQAAKIEGIGAAHILQHMAAGLLLCRAEISLGDDSNVFWALYICSLRTVCSHSLNEKFKRGEVIDGDATILYRYLHYHDILAQFSVSHWQRPTDMVGELSMTFKGQTVEFKCTTHFDRFYYCGWGDYLQYEIHILSLVLKASKEAQLDLEVHPGQSHAENVNRLEAEINEFLKNSKLACADLGSVDEKNPAAAADAGLRLQRYLFMASTWIYFQRTCRHLTGPSAAVDALFDEIFAMSSDMQRLDVRITPFSLFLIGAEANTDARRRAVLDVIHSRPELMPVASKALELRGDKSTPSYVDCLVAAAWAQDDLHDDSDGYLDYVTKMQYVISARAVLPALV